MEEEIIIESTDHYIGLVSRWKGVKERLLAVKSHLESGLPMVITIENNIAKCKKIDNKTPIAELDLSEGFITNQLILDVKKVDKALEAINAAMIVFLTQ